MHFSAVIAAIAIMASTATAQVDIENIAAFESFSNPSCQPQARQNQNIHSNNCTFLPDQSARVTFLEKQRANCRLEFYASSNCAGTPENVITSAPSDCINVSSLFSYEAICS
ncbi:hypothetical protein CFE70_003377 [Pyrenophora teres f. teres 0-1]|uniref:Uncharacterized protein n=2 Tax=Pyrenophora teres f. teres TaxID=97479 RepID=E3RMK7_PYRTT|nr:hypothetical protein PTT_09690 [Pyrenophora teres f. teres 0-1]KAE8846151.1 hypothetical protein HRS9139_00718 [Pyrenophora teres f. teres]CAA9959937.1 hypothetical protein PTMSG1_03345 [Pyrenophora teres f. maculata]KAE8848291.1 hypothetical protein PTNB85_02134 [Pyrenophora teres f. teres]KAE8853543.1 hypothetical protein HRS9122_00535 [Pyrenophora teres f. teres]